MAAWKPANAAGTSWTVKGVQEATREAVRDAAAQAGMLLGEWVDYALRDAARAALHPAPPPATREDVAALMGKLEQLEGRLASLANGMASAQAVAELEARLKKLAERPGGYDRPAVRHVMVERKRSFQPPHPVIPEKPDRDDL